MNKYLLDTNILFDYLRSREAGTTILKTLFSKEAVLGICSVVVTEVYAGIKDKERPQVKELLESFEYFEVTREIAILAGDYLRKYYKSKGVTFPDATMAAIAQHYDLILVTLNKKHYPMPELKIY